MMDNVLTLSTCLWGNVSTVALTGLNNVHCFVLISLSNILHLLLGGLRTNCLNSFFPFYLPYCRMSVTVYSVADL